MSMAQPLSRPQIAWRIAQDIPDGAYVNLGIGMPEMVANYLPDDREVMLHSENGILGLGPSPTEGEEDWDLINAGKKPVTLVEGGSYFHHTDSFAMVRGGHLDLCVLGAYQVSAQGDLANWSTGDDSRLPAIGGAMDLAMGSRGIYVMMELCTRQGAPKILDRCTYPLTGQRCVNRVYSDYAVIDIADDGPVVREMIDGIDLAGLQDKAEARLRLADDWRTLKAPDL